MESRESLIALCAEIDALDGWDFSQVRDHRSAVPWDYADIVSAYASESTLLDMGTGGAEILLTFVSPARTVVAVDVCMDMLKSAAQNVINASQANVSLVCADNLALSFQDDSFDLVCNRHSTYSVEEVVRVLRPGGHFVTQQVGRNNSRSILSAFGWSADSYGANYWPAPPSAIADAFREKGLKVLREEEYDVDYWFKDIKSLIFWLRAVPLPESFEIDSHWMGLQKLVEENTTSLGIKTNEHRTLLVCEKAPWFQI